MPPPRGYTRPLQDSQLAAIEQALSRHQTVTATTWQSAFRRADPSLVANGASEVTGIVHDGPNVLVRLAGRSDALTWAQFKSSFEKVTVAAQSDDLHQFVWRKGRWYPF